MPIKLIHTVTTTYKARKVHEEQEQRRSGKFLKKQKKNVLEGQRVDHRGSITRVLCFHWT